MASDFMLFRKWIVKAEGKEYVIEADYGGSMKDEDSGDILFQRNGQLLVDGKQVETWGSDGLPKEVRIEIGGKPAIFQKKGFLALGLELIFDGKRIKPA